MVESLDYPVGLARLLASNGLGLKAAHDALNTLVNDQAVTVVLRPMDSTDLLDRLRAMRLHVSVLQPAGFSASR